MLVDRTSASMVSYASVAFACDVAGKAKRHMKNRRVRPMHSLQMRSAFLAGTTIGSPDPRIHERR